MSFLLKSLLFIVIVAVGAGFVISKVPAWRGNVLEFLNPAIKEGRLLGDLNDNLTELDKNISKMSSKDPSYQSQVAKSKELLSSSRTLLSNIQNINQQNSGIIRQQIGKVIDAIIDKTPYAAEILTTPLPNQQNPAPTCIQK